MSSKKNSCIRAGGAGSCLKGCGGKRNFAGRGAAERIGGKKRVARNGDLEKVGEKFL